MTSTEIAVSLVAALFALYAIAMSFGCFYDRRKFTKRIEDADKRAATAQENSGYFSRKLAYMAERLHQVDQGIGRAIHRIIDAHSEEHSHRLANDHPESYHPDGGKRHTFIAVGMVRALNILEEETGRYKEVEEEPSPAQLDAVRRCLVRPSGGCIVCGTPATVTRWGKVDVELVPVPYHTKVTVCLGQYDYWQTRRPLRFCQRCADTVGGCGGTVVFYLGERAAKQRQSYVTIDHRTGGTPSMRGYPRGCRGYE